MSSLYYKFIKCESCGGSLTILMSNCSYCGSPNIPERNISQDAIERMKWTAFVLDAKLWKNQLPLITRYTVNLMVPLLLLEAIVFGAFFYISSSVWKSFVPTMLISIFSTFVYYTDLSYYFSNISELKIFKNAIEPVINEFLIGNNYYRYEFEQAVKSVESSKITRIRKWFSPTSKSLPENGNDMLMGVVQYHSNLCSDNSFATNEYKCGYAFLILSFIFGIISFISLYSMESFQFALIFLFPGWIFLFLEMTDRTSFIFNYFGYEPDAQFIKNELIPSLEKYCQDTGITMDSIINKSKEMNKSLHFYIDNNTQN